MSRLVIRLKAIKYKKVSFCYLSSQAIPQIVSLGRMPLGRTLFAIRLYHQAVCNQVALSDPSFHFVPNFYPNTVLLLYHQKFRILDQSEKQNRTFSFSSPSPIVCSSLSSLPVVSNGEYLKATLVTFNFSCRGVKQIPRNSALLRSIFCAT